MSSKTPTTMREATLADVPSMAEVTSAAFLDDEVFGLFMHPTRKEFPDDWNYSWQKAIRGDVVDAGSMSYVCVDDASGRITAMCLCKRLGDGGSKVSDPLAKKVNRVFISLHDLWTQYTWKDRSADADAIAKFDSNWDDIKHHFDGARKECWIINFLGVHPDFQHQGLGQTLVNKVLELAKKESPPVAVALISSAAADSFYEKLGFEEVGRANVGDMKDVEGGSIKFYESHLSSEGRA